MEVQDKEIRCVDCEKIFIFGVGEQEFYAKKKYSEPKRCKECRKIKRESRKGDV